MVSSTQPSEHFFFHFWRLKKRSYVVYHVTLAQPLRPGPSSLGVPGVPWHTQILADQLTLFQPGGTDYAHLITTGTPRFSDLPMALKMQRNAYSKC